MSMEGWRFCWRKGIEPLLRTDHLEVLLKALDEDDPKLLQGATTIPPPLYSVMDWPVEKACPMGFCGWQGDSLKTVKEVEEFFARLCYETDKKLGEPGGCRYFINAIDEWTRKEMRVKLSLEIRENLANRLAKLNNPA